MFVIFYIASLTRELKYVIIAIIIAHVLKNLTANHLATLMPHLNTLIKGNG